jgi:hypothetical protein
MIYHLHIPRTSGIYVKQNVLPHLISGGVPHFISNRTDIDINKIKTSKMVGGHFGLMPLKHMDNPDVFTVIRHPVDRFISYFNYTTGLVRMGEEAERKLQDWLYGDQAEIQANSQSKFLTGSTNILRFNEGHKYIQDAVNNNWYLEDYSTDINKVLENVDRFYAYTLDNHNLFLEDLNKSLSKHFGFTTFKHRDRSNLSPDIGIKLTPEQINRVLELNQVDLGVYEYVQKSKKRY